MTSATAPCKTVRNNKEVMKVVNNDKKELPDIIFVLVSTILSHHDVLIGFSVVKLVNNWKWKVNFTIVVRLHKFL